MTLFPLWKVTQHYWHSRNEQEASEQWTRHLCVSLFIGWSVVSTQRVDEKCLDSTAHGGTFFVTQVDFFVVVSRCTSYPRFSHISHLYGSVLGGKFWIVELQFILRRREYVFYVKNKLILVKVLHNSYEFFAFYKWAFSSFFQMCLVHKL